MTNKERYASFCVRHPDMPIMFQPWWLDAVCAGKEWDVLLFTREDLDSAQSKDHGAKTGEVLAAMPYMLRKLLGYTFIIMPQMTMFGGAWIDQDINADPNKQQRLAELIMMRIKELKVAFYMQDFSIGSPMPHWLKKKRFNTREICYNIISPDISTANVHTSDSPKQNDSITAETFYRFHSDCLKAQGLKINYSREFLIVLERKSSRSGKSDFVRVCSSDGKMQAAAFLVWDNNALYPLITCATATHDADIDNQLNQLIAEKALSLGVNIVYPESLSATGQTHYRVWKFVNPWLAPFFYFAYRTALVK